MPLAAGARLQDCLLTPSEINDLNTQRRGLTVPVLDKLETALDLLKSSHNIPPETYPVVFSTSDVHADLCKLHNIFKGINIIESDTYSSINDIMSNDIKPKLMGKSGLKWLLVIVGDIVDGQRIDNSTKAVVGEVTDPTGNIELLLHAYLYNLRIKARMIGCEIRFTVGNHDMATVVDAPYDGSREFYKAYVHRSAQTFFGDFENRRRCLLPFYDCCPYFLVTIGTEIAFVHGGLHNIDGTVAYESLKTVQEKVDAAGYLGTITDAEVLSSVSDASAVDKPLWSRVYSKGIGEGIDDDIAAATACTVAKSNNPFKLTVVGHCPTDNGFSHHNHIMKDSAYTGCDTGGCVLLGCSDDTNGMPRVAFVDITMSSGFREHTDPAREMGRRAEVLLLQFQSNIISSISRAALQYNGAGKITTPKITRVWPVASKGGRRTLRARRGYRKTR
jgi:hypothetical protein